MIKVDGHLKFVNLTYTKRFNFHSRTLLSIIRFLTNVSSTILDKVSKKDIEKDLQCYLVHSLKHTLWRVRVTLNYIYIFSHSIELRLIYNIQFYLQTRE